MVGSLGTLDVPLFKPRHQITQALAHSLDLMLRSLLTELLKIRATIVGLLNPLFGKFAGLDVLESALHLLLHRSVDNSWASLHVTPLSGVRDRKTHSGNTGLVDKVNREL